MGRIIELGPVPRYRAIIRLRRDMIFKDAVLYKARVLYVKKQYVLRCHFNGRQRLKILHTSHMKINFIKIGDLISLFSYLRPI